MTSASARFRAAYGAHRAAEGRRYRRAELLSLPYLDAGPLATQWAVRARTFAALVRNVLRPAAARDSAGLRLIDLGAGNGWLCYRTALAGHRPVALDFRDDDVDGLGAAGAYLETEPRLFDRIAGSFAELPFRDGSFDIAVFNASLHYALDLEATLSEAARVVRRGGRICILDSPFYDRETDGMAMMAEKHRNAHEQFGDRADVLLALPFIEFLTRDRLNAASRPAGLNWRRHRVRYPLWYELRPLVARLRRARPTSRFDLWESTIP
jgi:SAM-dependent methyltransferase